MQLRQIKKIERLFILAVIFATSALAQEIQRLEMVLQNYHSSEGIPIKVFSPNGKLLATGGSDKAVMLWDVSTMFKLRAFSETEPPEEIIFTPDSKIMVTRTLDRVKVWHVKTVIE